MTMVSAVGALEALLPIALGVALAAAVGLRVFLPLCALSLAGWMGWVELAEGFAWLGSGQALIMLSVAAVVEVAAYYLPGIDNALDALATPVAIAAGTLATAAVITDLPPLVKWTTAVIAGGGMAGLTHGVTSLLRLKSTAATGGLGNPVLATGELGGAALLSVAALAAPLLALGLVLGSVWLATRWLRRRMDRTRHGGPVQ
jgi:hypothetical protein